jgi:hypothetical protein
MLFDTKTNEVITSAIGAFNIVNDLRRSSTRTGVIEILSENNERYFIKIHNRLSRWNPEVYAYMHWTESLGSFAPTLVTSFNESNEVFGIVMSPIVGKTVNEMQLTDNDKLIQIYYKAGQLFKQMQMDKVGGFFGIPKTDGNPLDENVITDPVFYITDSLEMWYKSAYDLMIIDDAYSPLIEWCLRNCDIFKGEVPVPTNWDLSQNNWMVDEQGTFTGFIDFENMRWGISLDSFAVITERYTFDKPLLKQSFFDGYGLKEDEITKHKQMILSVNSSIASIVFGHRDSNTRFFDCGMRMLKHIKDNRIV